MSQGLAHDDERAYILVVDDGRRCPSSGGVVNLDVECARRAAALRSPNEGDPPMTPEAFWCGRDRARVIRLCNIQETLYALGRESRAKIRR